MKYRLLIAAACISLSGCASVNTNGISAAVNTYARPEAQVKKRFALAPASDKTPTTDMQYAEFAAHVEKALIAQGYTKAEMGSPPNVVIFLGYGIGEPVERQESYSIPVFGQTGVSSSQTYGTVSGNSYSATTYNTPTFGITGFNNGVSSHTTFTRRLILDAYGSPNDDGENSYQIWKTTATSIGSSGDLRYIFPYLVKASQPYFGVNTGKSIMVSQSLDPKELEPPTKK